jgi:hypothetical protein
MKSNVQIALTVFLICGALTMAQQPYTDPLDVAALAASSGNPQAVQTLTDTVVSYLPFAFHPSIGLNGRLFQAELLYRQHGRKGIGVGELVSALNSVAEALQLPSYVKTNVSQMQTYRLRMARVYPALVGPAAYAPGGQPDLSLCPSAAAFVIFHLLQLKLIEPSYQVDPDTWVSNVSAKAANQSSTPSRSTSLGIGTPVPPPSAQYQSIASGLATNSGSTAAPVLALLSTLGI